MAADATSKSSAESLTFKVSKRISMDGDQFSDFVDQINEWLQEDKGVFTQWTAKTTNKIMGTALIQESDKLESLSCEAIDTGESGYVYQITISTNVVVEIEYLRIMTENGESFDLENIDSHCYNEDCMQLLDFQEDGFRLKSFRFVDMVLLLSKDVIQSNLILECKLMPQNQVITRIADVSIKGAEARLLIPAIHRNTNCERNEKIDIDLADVIAKGMMLNVGDDASLTASISNIRSQILFWMTSSMRVKVARYQPKYYEIPIGLLPCPIAVGNYANIQDLRQGILKSRACHDNIPPQLDVWHFLDLSKELKLIGVIHPQPPLWFMDWHQTTMVVECPSNEFSVLRPDSSTHTILLYDSKAIVETSVMESMLTNLQPLTSETVQKNVMEYMFGNTTSHIEEPFPGGCCHEQFTWSALCPEGFMVSVYNAPNMVGAKATEQTIQQWQWFFVEYYDQFIELMLDERPGRESKFIPIFKRKKTPTRCSSLVTSECFDRFMSVVDKLATAKTPLDGNGMSIGPLLVQKMLVLISEDQQISLIGKLTWCARNISFDKNGCFVVSQILQEAIRQGSSFGVRCWAHMMMMIIHRIYDADDTQQLMLRLLNGDPVDPITLDVFKSKLERSMTHLHANHAFKMWIELLALQNNLVHCQQIIENIVAFAKKEVVLLAMSNQGVRCLTTLLAEHCSNTVMPVVDALLERDCDLMILMCDQFANHAIQRAIDHEPQKFARIVNQSFLTLARDPYGNFVLQKCIVSCEACSKDFYESFKRCERELYEHSQRIYEKIRSKLMTRLMSKEEVQRTYDSSSSSTSNSRRLVRRTTQNYEQHSSRRLPTPPPPSKVLHTLMS